MQLRAATPQERAQAQFDEGWAKFQEGRISEAEAAWRKALTIDPNQEEARQALLGVLLDRGQRDEAERLLQEGLAANPRQTKLSMQLARLQIGRGDQAAAQQTLEAGLPYAQWSGDYLSMTAAVMVRAGRNRDAAQLYQAALRVSPGNAVRQMGLGIALRADGKRAEALAAFKRARDLRALNPDLQAFVDTQIRELQ